MSFLWIKIAMHILLIDDDNLDRKAVKRALKKSNLTIELEEATNGKTARKLFESVLFDCVLLDYRLPDIDGITLARELLSSAIEEIAVPIIMLTGEGNEAIAVEAMKSGVQDYLPKSAINVDTLSRAINSAVEKALLLKQIHEMNEKYEHLALIDTLTGLGNRNLFYDRFENLIATARRTGNLFALLMMDLNKFKAINDSYGHAVGDEVLHEVGKRLNDLCRDADSFFRLGGDEFAALINTGVDRKGIKVLAEKIHEAFGAPMKFNSISLQPGISIGIAIYSKNGESDDLLHQADIAMYKAKRNGEKFIIYNSEKINIAD